MNSMHNIKLDLNLLVIAESLFRTLNVTKTASELNLSQSAISHALKRLRDHYQDPLFVRVSKGMAPTNFGKGIRCEVTEIVKKASDLSHRIDKFDPKTAKGIVTIEIGRAHV